MSRRKKNAGEGYGYMFHGAFKEKADAQKKERQRKGSFIKTAYYKDGMRYLVMSPRKNPPRRRRGRNAIGRISVFHDRGIGKFTATTYSDAHGNIYAAGHTKKEALKNLRDRLRLIRKGQHPGYGHGYAQNPTTKYEAIVIGRRGGEWRQTFDTREDAKRWASQFSLEAHFRPHIRKIKTAANPRENMTGVGVGSWVHTPGRSEVYRVLEMQGGAGKWRYLLEGPYPSKARVWTRTGRVYPAATPNPQWRSERDRKLEAKVAKLAQQAAKRGDLNAFNRHMRTLKLLEAERGENNPIELIVMGANPLGDHIGPADWHREMLGRLLETYRGWRAIGYSHEDAVHETLNERHSIAGPAVREEFLSVVAAGENPEQRAINPSAAAIREDFTGRPAKRYTIVDEPHMPAGDYAQLGELLALYVKPPGGGQVQQINFKKDRPLVLSDESARQIWFSGGDQDLRAALDVFHPRERGAGLFEIGEARRIDYKQRKHHVPDPDVDEWRHEFGEETGERPIVLFDSNKVRLLLEGGDYRIEAAGIIN